jgi:hypothetical protein
MLEQNQVKLRIVQPTFRMTVDETGEYVTGKHILDQMKKNQVFKNDSRGKYVPILFDGREFDFREGETITVGETISNALRRMSTICVGGDKLNGPIVPFLEIVSVHSISEAEPEAKTPTTCPICGEDQKTFPRLTRHLGVERKNHPELFVDEEDKYEAKAAVKE